MNILDQKSSTNLLTSKTEMSKDDFINEILPKIQEILKKVFPNNQAKQKIRVHRDRISFAAPCCGDSASNNYKKRGNIILEGKFKNLYKCFNCGTCMSVPKFLKTYGQSMSLEMVDYVSSSKNIHTTNSSTDEKYSCIYDDKLIESLSIEREYFKQLLGLKECTEQCFGRTYLIKRKQYNFEKFLYSEKVNKLFILNLTKSGKIFGMQVRSFDNKNAKYKTYSLKKIHEMILHDDASIPEEINELSMIFNILLVNYSLPIIVTEGPMDSFLVKNAIALCGAGKNIEFPFMVKYIFDDDKTGREHAIEKLRDGHYVFMWDQFKKDIGIKSNGKLDINDIVKLSYEKNIVLPKFENYFTNDELDLIFI